MSRESSAPSGPSRNGSFSIRNRVLLTGFEPFGGAILNPSQLVAEALQGQVVAGLRIHSLVLPCRFGSAAADLARAVRRLRPGLVICLGLASRRRAVTPESVAWNRINARIADNAGLRPRGRRILATGPARLSSGLPVREIAAAVRAAGLPARVSGSAGHFVCNELFYRLMRELAKHPGVRGGFIHVPPLRTLTRKSQGPSLARLVRAVRIAIEVSALAGGRAAGPVTAGSHRASRPARRRGPTG
jgi:pyroglutamyl-peptidase